jgi:hypothetical protein
MNQSIPRDSQHVPATVAKCQVCRGLEVEYLVYLYQMRYRLLTARRDKLNIEPVPAADTPEVGESRTTHLPARRDHA